MLCRVSLDHSKGAVCSSGGIISDRLWTCHTLLVSLALIPLSPLCSEHLFRLCAFTQASQCMSMLNVSSKGLFCLISPGHIFRYTCSTACQCKYLIKQSHVSNSVYLDMWPWFRSGVSNSRPQGPVSCRV